jgi:hypothetical protein
MDGRKFRIDGVDFDKGKVSLQDMAIGAESLRISLQGLQRELSALAAARWAFRMR